MLIWVPADNALGLAAPQLLVNVPVPPLKFSVPVPSESPLQLTLVVFAEEDISGGDNNVMMLVNAHPTESITFVDYANKDYIGLITYYATIVKIDGTIISENTVSSTLLVDRSPSKKSIRNRIRSSFNFTPNKHRLWVFYFFIRI